MDAHFDYDAAQAIKSRKAILDRVSTDGYGDGLSFPFRLLNASDATPYHWEAAQ